MENQDKDKKEYELALLLKSETDLASALEIVTRNGGEISTEARAKNLSFAYEVKGVSDGVFAYCNFKVMADAAKEIERELNASHNVLRFMIIASPAPAEKIAPPGMPSERRGKPSRFSAPSSEQKPPVSHSLSNEALEKKIEEIVGTE